MTSVCGFLFYLRFTQEFFYHLHLPWGQHSFVFTITHTFEGIEEATGEVQFLAEEVDGTRVATVGIVEEGLSINGNAKMFVLNNNVNFDTTGIDELKGENENVKTAVYELSGRRVQKAQKGIFIQNGKKIVK